MKCSEARPVGTKAFEGIVMDCEICSFLYLGIEILLKAKTEHHPFLRGRSTCRLASECCSLRFPGWSFFHERNARHGCLCQTKWSCWGSPNSRPRPVQSSADGSFVNIQSAQTRTWENMVSGLEVCEPLVSRWRLHGSHGFGALHWLMKSFRCFVECCRKVIIVMDLNGTTFCSMWPQDMHGLSQNQSDSSLLQQGALPISAQWVPVGGEEFSSDFSMIFAFFSFNLMWQGWSEA